MLTQLLQGYILNYLTFKTLRPKTQKFYKRNIMNFWFVSFSKSVKVSVHWWKCVNNLVISRRAFTGVCIKLTYESCLSSMENVREPPTGETFGKCQNLKWIRIQYSRYNRFFNVWILEVRNRLKPYYINNGKPKRDSIFVCENQYK